MGVMSDPAERERRYKRGKKAKLTRLVSEGDSWFDYPPHTNIIDWIDLTERFAIKRFEVSGDTIHHMETTSGKVADAVVTEEPLCVLLSAGGNDIVEKSLLDKMLLEFDPKLTPRQHLNAEWKIKLDVVADDLLRFMDDLGEHVPIIAHGYDVLTPSNKAVKFDGFRVSQPVLLPAMKLKHIDNPVFQRAIVKEMIDDFNVLLARIQATHPLHFLHIDLRGTFTESDFLNEIHLKRDGFKVVANRFIDAIDNRLPAVLQARKDAGL